MTLKEIIKEAEDLEVRYAAYDYMSYEHELMKLFIEFLKTQLDETTHND